jgi:hypothetical protein
MLQLLEIFIQGKFHQIFLPERSSEIMVSIGLQQRHVLLVVLYVVQTHNFKFDKLTTHHPPVMKRSKYFFRSLFQKFFSLANRPNLGFIHRAPKDQAR